MSEYRLAIPFVAGIVERTHHGEKQILLQTRWKPGRDSDYSGTLEFPAGVLDLQYESVYDAVAREVKEEAGLTLLSIRGQDDVSTVSTGKDDMILGFSPYYCTQQLRAGKPWVGFIFICEVEDGVDPMAQESETRDPYWISCDAARDMVHQTPEKFFGLELPALMKYLEVQ